jgi:hypothetical protein
MEKLKEGYFRIGEYMLEVTDKSISWGIKVSWEDPDRGDEMFLGRGFLEHDLLVLGSWKCCRPLKDTDPHWDQLPAWGQSRYWLKMDDFGNIGGPFYVSTGERVPAEEIADTMRALGFQRAEPSGAQ